MALFQKTDTLGEDGFDNPQMRGCARGRSLRGLVFGADRLKYPIKRKNWQPGGENVNGHLRGKDEWERLSWEEALDMAATETKRIIDTYGNVSILTPKNAGPNRFLCSVGGTTSQWCCTSSGGFYWTSQKMIGGGWPYHALTLSDRFEYRDSKLIVLWGHNPTWASQGGAIYHLMAAKEAGAKIIVVDPIYHDAAKIVADEFIPVRPATDAAFFLALAHEMIINNLQDQEFLDKYCVGFDAEHMPEGADPTGNFKDYVLGTYDGMPKTAEWASKICGTPVEMIKSLAQQMATIKPLAFTCTRAPARTYHGDQFAQGFLTVGWMTGEVGKKGSMVGHVVTSNVGSFHNGPRLIAAGSSGVPGIANPVSPYRHYQIDPFDEGDWSTINQSEVWDATIDGKYQHGVRGVLPIDIRMINHMGSGCGLNQYPGMTRGIEAHRKVDFVLADGYFMHTNARYADIVFPITTPWEAEGRTLLTKTNKEMVLAIEQITEPLFEAKPDIYLEEELAVRLGVDREVIAPLSRAQQIHNQLAGATVLAEDGVTKETLFTITAADIPSGVEGEPQQGKITLDQFFTDKVYRVKRSPGDNYGYTALKDYIDDPVANPRETSTGKFEIYCQAISDWCDAVGYTSKPPIAVYQVPEEGYETTFSDWENQVKGPYPLQLLALHCLRTVHSSYDNVPYVREAFPNELLINPVDANERGVKNGDTVLITSKHGKSLRIASVSERIMPGVLRLDQCSWVDVDEEDGIDRAGSPNYLIGPLKSGSGIQAWNNCNVQVEKWTGTPLEPDCLWPQRVLEV